MLKKRFKVVKGLSCVIMSNRCLVNIITKYPSEEVGSGRMQGNKWDNPQIIHQLNIV